MPVRQRVGTRLWLGDESTRTTTATVLDVHRVRRGRENDAERLYAQYRGWTLDAIAGLRDTGSLTPLGEDFVDRLDATVRGWDA